MVLFKYKSLFKKDITEYLNLNELILQDKDVSFNIFTVLIPNTVGGFSF